MEKNQFDLYSNSSNIAIYEIRCYFKAERKHLNLIMLLIMLVLRNVQQYYFSELSIATLHFPYIMYIGIGSYEEYCIAGIMPLKVATY